MKSLLFFLSLLLTGQCYAAQKFSFAGLKWNAQPNEVERNLTEAGYKVKPITKFSEDYFVQEFDGKIQACEVLGKAYLYQGLLTMVSISMDASSSESGKACKEIPALLETRYGKPREVGPPDYELEWKSSSGEVLKMSISKGPSYSSHRSRHLSYLSPKAIQIGKQFKLTNEKSKRIEDLRKQADMKVRAAGL